VKILLTGAAGQVGRAVRAAAPAGAEITAFDREGLDIADRARVEAVFAGAAFDVVVNAAAYTAVDKAETERDAARRANEQGPALLAEVCRAAGTRLIHFSTDYVFDGTATAPYRPGDPTDPVNYYGETKLAGENAIRAALPDRHAIVRTAWVYASEGRNFLLTMLRLMQAGKPLAVVADQSGTPTSAGSVAEFAWALVARPGLNGTYHWTDAGQTTWHGFAAEIQRQAIELGLLAAAVELTPIPATGYATAARRPAWSVLDTTAAARDSGVAPAAWQDNVRRTLQEIARRGS